MNVAAVIDAIKKKCESASGGSLYGETEEKAGRRYLAEEILTLLEEDKDKESAAAVVALYGKIAGFEFDRPIVFLDLEATAKNPNVAKIIEVAAIKIYPDGREAERFNTLVNPGEDLSKEIVDLTGITDDDLRDAPPWAQVARPFLTFIGGAYLCGFGIMDFDVPLLFEEYFRFGMVWEVEINLVLEVANLYKKMEPRTLSAGVTFFLGREHKNAHRAMADAEAVLQILPAMLARYGDAIPSNFRELATFSAYDKRLDIAGKIVLNDEGIPVFNLGDQKGVPVAKNTKFAQWILDKKDFSENTKQVIRSAIRNNTIVYRH